MLKVFLHRFLVASSRAIVDASPCVTRNVINLFRISCNATVGSADGSQRCSLVIAQPCVSFTNPSGPLSFFRVAARRAFRSKSASAETTFISRMISCEIAWWTASRLSAACDFFSPVVFPSSSPGHLLSRTWRSASTVLGLYPTVLASVSATALTRSSVTEHWMRLRPLSVLLVARIRLQIPFPSSPSICRQSP